MKMSDVFTKMNQTMVKRAIWNACNGGVSKDSSRHIERMNSVLFSATEAVLNHDRLTSENERLRDALRDAVQWVNKGCCVQADGSHNYVAINNAEELLTELEKGDE